ncbi:MAG: VCBS repeat-containing protein, partial [Aurantibacter sp.]
MKRDFYFQGYIVLLLGMLSAATSCKPNNRQPEQVSEIDFELFEKVDSKISGVHFANNLKEEFSNGKNRFEFDYFYNGAGIGVADLNNDGLQGLFFVGNQVKSKLYLNKGNFVFEDISSSSNINQNKGWATGVTFADINNDGQLDIYVCQGGPLGYDRSNRLYINQGNLSFKEESAKYGLDYKGLSTQSAFFDYDHDGDLDCLIINEHPMYGYSAREFQYYLKKEPKLLHASSCHLFEYRNGKYEEVTEKAGLLKPAFGLGMVVTDINDDGFQDFYLSNDYYIPDAFYINQQDGTFKDEVKERTNQVAYAGMGVDIADLNNDGNYDIFSLDMASEDHIRSKVLMQPMDVKFFNYLTEDLDYQHAYMFNTLQLGLGNGAFQNVPHMAGVAKTDWSWAGLIADLDNDADKDIFVTNGTEFTLDNDFHAKVQEVYERYPAPQPIPIFELERLHRQIPNQKLPNVVFENQGGLQFKNRAQNWGLQDSTSSNGAVYADLDLDGDLDLVVNNNNQNALLYKNRVSEKTNRNYLTVKAHGLLSESFPKVQLRYKGIQQEIQISRVRGYLSSVENRAHFGLGIEQKVDTVSILWPSGVYEEKYNVVANQIVEFHEKDAVKKKRKELPEKKYIEPMDANHHVVDYSHKENTYDDFEKETLLPYKQSTLGPFTATGDVDGDGKNDLFLGGAAGQAGEIHFQTDMGFMKMDAPTIEADALCEDMEAVFFDIDNDNDVDLFVISGGNEYEEQSGYYADRLYINDGQGNFSKDSDKFNDLKKLSGKSVASLDFDKDGDI